MKSFRLLPQSPGQVKLKLGIEVPDPGESPGYFHSYLTSLWLGYYRSSLSSFSRVVIDAEAMSNQRRHN